MKIGIVNRVKLKSLLQGDARKRGSFASTMLPIWPREAGEVVVNDRLATVIIIGRAVVLREDSAAGGYRFQRLLPFVEGENTITITATDPQQESATQSWKFNVPGISRSFTYDDDGNTLTDGQRTMTWDAKNRLKTVTKGGTTWIAASGSIRTMYSPSKERD
jgi:hypothetical protein